MSIKATQFQRSLSLSPFYALYGTKAQCESALVAASWELPTRAPGCSNTSSCRPCTSAMSPSSFKIVWRSMSAYLGGGLGQTLCGPRVRGGQRRHDGIRQVIKAEAVHELHWVNTLLGSLKTSMAGTHHSFKHHEYAKRYLAEFC